MATINPTKSTIHLSKISDTHSRFVSFRKPHVGFNHNFQRKLGNLVSFNGDKRRISRNDGDYVLKKNDEKKQRGLGVKCTAEGIERGMLVGGRGEEGKYVIPERLKVVGLMACVMSLCNADRVVMSVAIVPLAAKHGWSSSFLGIVQVNL